MGIVSVLSASAITVHTVIMTLFAFQLQCGVLDLVPVREHLTDRRLDLCPHADRDIIGDDVR